MASSAFSQINGRAKMGLNALDINGNKVLAINFHNEKDWHTYWKNPGDAGLELKFKFQAAGKDIKLEEYPWPTPKRYIEQGNMWAYGYSDKYSMFFKLPESLKSSELFVHATWLICKDICIPGEAKETLKLDGNLLGKTGSTFADSDSTEAFKRLPTVNKPSNVSLFLTKGQKENQLALHFIVEDFDPAKLGKKSNVLFPFLQPPFDYKHEEAYYDEASKTLFGRFYVDWDGIYEDPVWNLPKDGVFKTPLTAKFLLNYPKSENAKIFTHTFKEFTLAGDKELSEKFKTLTNLLDKKKGSRSEEKKEENSLISYLLFAFLGGLILNLMPCVLPVISLKLFGLIVHSDEKQAQILKHNLSYTAGVLASFLVLATVVVILKTSGEQIGWGFQLQSSSFVYLMIVMIFVMALNMFGLFEFVTPGGKSLGNTEMKKGFGADFVNGVLATILSTPCSAPFLGTALTFAFTTSIFYSYLIFIFIGLGLSAPFILTGLFPALVKFLPKPGTWMEKLKYFLGLSLLLTCVWLVDVLFGLVDFSQSGLFFLTSLSFIFFGIFFAKKFKAPIALNIIVALLTFAFLVKTERVLSSTPAAASKTITGTTSNWSPWSKETMANLKGETVFVNFTAKWCLTCKVNKRLVLQSPDFSKLVREKNIKLLEADWTKRDEHITMFLKGYNIVGVPAYFIQKPDGSIVSLGETISLSKIKENL